MMFRRVSLISGLVLVPGSAFASGMPQLNPEHFAPQLVWLAIVFGLFYLVVKSVALPSIQGVLETRQKKIDDDIRAAEKLHEAAQAALKTYESTLAHARSTAHQTLAQRQAELNAEAERHKQKVEAELNAKLAKAAEEIRTKREAVMGHLRGLAVETAGSVVARLVGQADAAAVAGAVDAELARGRI